MSELVTVGCDPEVGIYDGGVPIPAIGLVGGSKAYPIEVVDGTLQEDNVWAEIGITPATTAEQFVSRIDSVLSQLQEKVHPYTVGFPTSWYFEYEDLKRLGRAALEAGCNPDTCFYTGLDNPKPDMRGGLRTCGGHIHIGTKQPAPLVTFAMDIEAGLPSVLIDRDDVRRTLYGRAGCYREKPYGVEYRTLSNFWLNSKSLKSWAFEVAVSAVNNAEHWIDSAIEDREIIQQCINSNDIELANKLIKKYGVRVP